MTHRDAPATALLRDGFARVGSGVHVVLEGLDNEELSWRVAPEANPLGWLVWHLSRQQDLQVAHLAGVETAWQRTWESQLALAYPPGASGYGMTPEEVASFTVEDGALLSGYHEATLELTMRWLDTVTDADWDRIVDHNWDPPVTLAARSVSILQDSVKHLGQAEYLRGILLRRRD